MGKFGWRGIVTSLMILSSLASIGMITVQARSFRDGEIEDHLNGLNKVAVRSIKLKDGDIVDCVNIYHQPAFDHPLLKNHKIQMPPTFSQKTNTSADVSHQPHIQPQWQESEGCPEGTIPILRVQRSDNMQSTSLAGFGRLDANDGQVEKTGMVLDQGAPYYGAQASINIWSVSVEPNEWSKASIELSNGDNFIEAGWMVNPQLFGDGKTRLYSYWTTNNYQGTGCFNLLCSGFVQTSPTYVLGLDLGPSSIFQGTQYFFDANIYKDQNNGNWWLVVQGVRVGYWPASLFGSNFDTALIIMWGGGVLNMNNGGQHTTTQMGSGHPVDGGMREAAFMANIIVLDAPDSGTPPQVPYVRTFSDRPGCYNTALRDPGVSTNVTFFGGPGGHDC